MIKATKKDSMVYIARCKWRGEPFTSQCSKLLWIIKYWINTLLNGLGAIGKESVYSKV